MDFIEKNGILVCKHNPDWSVTVILPDGHQSSILAEKPFRLKHKNTFSQQTFASIEEVTSFITKREADFKLFGFIKEA